MPADRAANRAFWDALYQDEPGAQTVDDFVVGAWAAEQPAGTALDVGCGTGELVWALAELGWRASGVDISPRALELARGGGTEPFQHPPRFLNLDARLDPLPEADLVSCCFALPSAEELGPILRNCVRAVAPGGTCLVVDWAPRMAAAWGHDPDAYFGPDALAAELSGLVVQEAGVRPFPGALVHGPRRTQEGTAWVSVIRAVREAEGGRG